MVEDTVFWDSVPCSWIPLDGCVTTVNEITQQAVFSIGAAHSYLRKTGDASRRVRIPPP
jgi:hypothetical protein